MGWPTAVDDRTQQSVTSPTTSTQVSQSTLSEQKSKGHSMQTTHQPYGSEDQAGIRKEIKR